MRRFFIKISMVIVLFAMIGLTTNCAKEGCPANQALYKESMGESAGGGKAGKKGKMPKPPKAAKTPKTSSGVLATDGGKKKKKKKKRR